jgi:hypothetical protein
MGEALYKEHMSNFERNLLLSRIGKHIVERILVKAGLSVVPFEYERITASAAANVKKDRHETRVYIRSIPDFLVVNEMKESFLIRVKTTFDDRHYYKLGDYKYLEKSHWPQAVFFIVNLHPVHNCVYTVERWGRRRPKERHVFVYYDEDDPDRGCCHLLEDFKGLGQSIPKKTVAEVIMGHNRLISQLLKAAKDH